MNRPGEVRTALVSRFPHLCGDEPYQEQLNEIRDGDFPTYVGMNRQDAHVTCQDARFPHLCGDEPLKKTLDG